jgi:hypothetical protein
MTAPESTVRSLPAQPPEPKPPTVTRIYRGDAVISLMEMIERCIPTARPLMSVADLRKSQPTASEWNRFLGPEGAPDEYDHDAEQE